jgi:uncharacterized membrane protein YfhO
MKLTKELIDAFAEGEVDQEYSYAHISRYSSTVNDCTLSVCKINTLPDDSNVDMFLKYDENTISFCNTDECKYAYYVLSRKHEEQKNDNRDNLIKTITEKVLG